ncbi:MAG: DUF992 domain-containing protein [Pseudomonadota bacterium]
MTRVLRHPALRTLSLAATMAAALFVGLSAGFATSASAQSNNRIETGLLECSGEGGWGLIIASKKTMRCTFTSVSGKPLGFYDTTITKYGLDVGVTGKTQMVWAVFAPASAAGDNYEVGSLDGQYTGVGAEATAGVGLGAKVLLGGGATSFALQPVSVKAQTGLNLAAGVETVRLRFVGPVGE